MQGFSEPFVRRSIRIVVFHVIRADAADASAVGKVQRGIIKNLTPFRISIDFRTHAGVIIYSTCLPALLKLYGDNGLPLPVFKVRLIDFLRTCAVERSQYA